MTKTDQITQSLADSLAEIERHVNEREAQFRAEFGEHAHQTGPCPGCQSEQPLDEEETVAESTRRGSFCPIFAVCERCEREIAYRTRLERFGVPARVQHATLANYEIIDPKQREAVGKVRTWTRDPAKLFLLLVGTCGAGKGHLAAAALRALDRAATWTTHKALVDGYHNADFGPVRDRFVSRHANIPVLVIDEMGGKGITTDTEEIFYSILDPRYDRKRKTILIGNIPFRATKEGNPDILGLIGRDRMESRLAESGEIVGCRFPDYRKRNKN